MTEKLQAALNSLEQGGFPKHPSRQEICKVPESGSRQEISKQQKQMMRGL